jgi:tryprostatin B 6-hydroxylase
MTLQLMRLILAYTVWYYDFEFAPDEDGDRIIKERRNTIVIKPGRLDLVFKRRIHDQVKSEE